MKTKYSRLSAAQRSLLIIRIILSLVIIITALLQLFDIWPDAINVTVPLMGIVSLLQAIGEWKNSRPLAVFSLCASLFIFGCAVAVFFIK